MISARGSATLRSPSLVGSIDATGVLPPQVHAHGGDHAQPARRGAVTPATPRGAGASQHCHRRMWYCQAKVGTFRASKLKFTNMYWETGKVAGAAVGTAGARNLT
jgi:hypothetical protein